jgi:hypothetical protein
MLRAGRVQGHRVLIPINGKLFIIIFHRQVTVTVTERTSTERSDRRQIEHILRVGEGKRHSRLSGGTVDWFDCAPPESELELVTGGWTKCWPGFPGRLKRPGEVTS